MAEDPFESTRMSFGEHIEDLRRHLIHAGLGLLLAVIGCLFFGIPLVKVVEAPIVAALNARADQPTSGDAQPAPKDVKRVRLHVLTTQPAERLRQVERLTNGAMRLDPASGQLVIEAEIHPAGQTDQPQRKRLVVLGPLEGFVTYLKVSLIAGFILASPWVFYQLWHFVAVGLYYHERRYIFLYLPFSIGLFLGGVVFCYFGVFPAVLAFLLEFTAMMNLETQIRLSEWVSFAVWLPLVFGLAFQVPIVMLLLNRLNLATYTELRAKWKMAILLSFVIGMVLTPPDPASQILMALPMIVLFLIGLLIVRVAGKRSAFEGQTPVPPAG